MKSCFSACVLVFLLLFSCAARCAERDRMLGLGPYLLMLSQNVEWTLRGGNPPAGLSEEDLLLLATLDDPGLLDRFADYRLRVLRAGGHCAVLVCTKDGQQGLLEDAACSDGLDRHLWQERPPRPCAFTLDLEQACGLK